MLEAILKQDEKIEEVIKFPCLRIFSEAEEEGHFVALFNSSKDGIIIYVGDDSIYEIGDKHSDAYDKGFELFYGSIEIKQF